MRSNWAHDTTQRADVPNTTEEPRVPRIDVVWGLQGARHLASEADVVVVVDVLSFSTSVAVACERGAWVWPHPGGPEAELLARALGAVLAGPRVPRGAPSLSPTSLLDLPRGTRLLLPSPNGSAISHALSGGRPRVVAGALHNAAAVARWVAGAPRVAVVPAGERWDDGSLRFAYEDLVGAGAVVERLTACVPRLVRSPAADAAARAFVGLRPLEDTPSGRELVDRGFAEDVELAARVDASHVVPVLAEGRFVAASQSSGRW
jgi:2-phosphosulfolactate phosphatase